MTKPQKRLLITPSLLNSWLYIDQVEKVYKEKLPLVQEDIANTFGEGVGYEDLSEEDKAYYGRQLAFQDFVNTLNKIPFEPNKFMIAGIEFEAECVATAENLEKGIDIDYTTSEGALEFGKIIAGGSFQAVGTKEVTIDGVDFLMYGRLDVLKAGVIYDIKRVVKYERPKYKWSSQHGFYMDLFPNVKYFEYLVYNGYKTHKERYSRFDYTPTESVIKDFMEFLKNNGLWEVYCEKWISNKE